MSKKAMSLKGKINNYAKNKRIPAQVVLQNYMFEKFFRVKIIRSQRRSTICTR